MHVLYPAAVIFLTVVLTAATTFTCPEQRQRLPFSKALISSSAGSGFSSSNARKPPRDPSPWAARIQAPLWSGHNRFQKINAFSLIASGL